jgi:hypothetical protein
MIINEDVREKKEKGAGRKPMIDEKENDNINHNSNI